MNNIRYIFSYYYPFTAFINMRPGSGNIKCPFHDDKNPSAKLYLDTDGIERIYCFSCRKQYMSYDYYRDVVEADVIKMYRGIPEYIKDAVSKLLSFSNSGVNPEEDKYLNSILDKKNDYSFIDLQKMIFSSMFVKLS